MPHHAFSRPQRGAELPNRMGDCQCRRRTKLDGGMPRWIVLGGVPCAAPPDILTRRLTASAASAVPANGAVPQPN
eukprot:scaffold3772_cov390-Prasinococcus_capsulatus_cf.AAC.13